MNWLIIHYDPKICQSEDDIKAILCVIDVDIMQIIVSVSLQSTAQWLCYMFNGKFEIKTLV